MGRLIRRSVDGDELVAEWSPENPASVAAAEKAFHEWLSRDHEAVRSDGTFVEPVEGGNVFPVDAAEVILTTGMGGG